MKLPHTHIDTVTPTCCSTRAAAAEHSSDVSHLHLFCTTCLQISLFAMPVCVLVGWATGHPFTLAFEPFPGLALTLAVIHANFITSDATSHWLMGVQLLAVYLLIAIAFLFR